MKIIADTHTHTIASTHAYSTILENIEYAKRAGLSAIAITDHAPEIEDAPHFWHFYNLTILQREIDGVALLRGVECNILDENGAVDLHETVLSRLDWIIASFHKPVKDAKNDSYTNAYLKLAENKYIDVIGHSGTPDFAYDYEKCVKKFKEYGKIVELNENSIEVRKGSCKNCLEIAKLCKKYEVMVVVNSDAHFALNIGKVNTTLKMLEEIEFPENLVLNACKNRFFGYMKDKKGIEYNNII